MNGDSRFQSGYGNGYDNGSRAMYQQSPNTGRYGIMAGGRGLGPEGKMNGFHGSAKHKRGEIDRECENTLKCQVCLLTDFCLQIIAMPAVGSRISLARYQPCAKINMVVVSCKRSSKKASKSIETLSLGRHSTISLI
jgi:hypothetical protein